jgi:hypothetical protein
MIFYIWDKQEGDLVRNTSPQVFTSREDAQQHIERSGREEWSRYIVIPDPAWCPVRHTQKELRRVAERELHNALGAPVPWLS